MSEPTTDDIREEFVAGAMVTGFAYSRDEARADWDRWLATHDAQVRAEAERTRPVGRFGIEGDWLVWITDRHTCGTEPGGHFGHHEPGCGTEPVVQLSEIEGWAERTLPSVRELSWLIEGYGNTRDAGAIARAVLAKITTAPTVEQVRQEERKRIAAAIRRNGWYAASTFAKDSIIFTEDAARIAEGSTT